MNQIINDKHYDLEERTFKFQLELMICNLFSF